MLKVCQCIILIPSPHAHISTIPRHWLLLLHSKLFLFISNRRGLIICFLLSSMKKIKRGDNWCDQYSLVVGYFIQCLYRRNNLIFQENWGNHAKDLVGCHTDSWASPCPLVKGISMYCMFHQLKRGALSSLDRLRKPSFGF